MSTTPPADLAAAHQLITRLQHENHWLKHKLDVFSWRFFGNKTEKLSPGQITLAYEQLENELD